MAQSTSDAHKREINEKSVSQCPIIVMTQIQNGKPGLEKKSRSKNKSHTVLKLGKEFESKPMQR